MIVNNLFATEIATLGMEFYALVKDQAHWSQATFGADYQRGPIGALKHLELEAIEAQENPSDPMEYADCLLLTLDAARRAGISVSELVQASKAKLQVCKSRKWPAPDGDKPVEHIRT